ncbi:MAG: PEP-CTERM sorting domain-containing protein [Pirellulales bacterium]
MRKLCCSALAICALNASSLHAANLAISLGIRETGGAGPEFSNAGTTGGIEFVNLDGQSLIVDGTWQTFTFTPATDMLTAFAGTTADSSLEPGIVFAALEHIRIRNTDGITLPIRLWIDDVTSATGGGGTVVESFENETLGSEAMFQEPSFSGSTMANVVVGSTAVVSDSMALTGSQSVQADFQFIDNDSTRWVRLTTFPTTGHLLLNPAIRVRNDFGGATTVSFSIKAVTIPEPSTLLMAGMGLAWLALAGRRWRSRNYCPQ